MIGYARENSVWDLPIKILLLATLHNLNFHPMLDLTYFRTKHISA